MPTHIWYKLSKKNPTMPTTVQHIKRKTGMVIGSMSIKSIVHRQFIFFILLL